jgi:drug/metabolite transporter (DMT)-like permease
MPYVRFVVLCLIWGSSFLLMKRAGAGLSPWAIGSGRVFTGMAVLVVVAWWQARGWSRTLTWSHLPALIGVMLLGYAIPYFVQPLFISRTGNSALAGMGVGFTPLFTLALSVPILGVRPSFRQVLGVLGALACLALLLVDSVQRDITWLDVVLLFATPIMYAVANNWMRLSLSEIPPMELTVVCLGLSGLLLLPAACLASGPVAWSAPEIPPALASLLILGVFGTGMGMLMFNQLIHEQGPLFAVMVTNVTPIGAVILGWTDAERVTTLQLVALAGILLCVAVVQWGAGLRGAAANVD